MPRASEAAPEESAAPTAAPRSPREPLASQAQDAASFVFEELERVEDPQASLTRQAVESLLAMGAEGRAAARTRLDSASPAVLLTAGRVLLRGGEPDDRALLLQRLRSKLPSSVAQPLLVELTERDPVLVTPGLLTELLGHPTGSMRAAAERELGRRAGADLLPALAGALDARRADTRLRATTLVGGIADAGTLPLLAERLGDGNAKVAARAAEILATRTEAEAVVALLRDTAFAGTGPLDAGRRGAYALLSLVQREERSGAVSLGDEDVPRLLTHLRARDAMTSVSAAIALAGIGFRSADSDQFEWLDLDVPHALVRWGSGAEFHSDFSSVHELALRRVGLLSGESFGQDGPAWRRWWTERAGRFRARRAVVPASLLDAPALSLQLRTGFRAEEALAVLGPAAEAARTAGAERVVYMDVERSEALFALLEREGAFGAERLPATTSAYRGGRLLDLQLGERGKTLEEPRGGEAWFERLISVLESLEEENRWQRWFDPLEHTDQRSFWEAERERVAAAAGPVERARLEVDLLLSRVAAFGRSTLEDQREDEVLAALSERFARPGVARPSDFPRLADLLRAERFHGSRAALLLELAIAAGRVAPIDDAAAPAAEATRLDLALGQDLLALLVDQTGPAVPDALQRVLDAQGPELARSAAASPDARLRASAALALARSTADEDQAILGVLLDDPEAQVEAAAVRAIASTRAASFAPELLARARLAPPAVRSAALGGLVNLDHPEALELLRVALYEPELELQLAGAEGLAALRDPAASAVLARLLTRGPASPLFSAARAGLLGLGTRASDDLLVLANSGAEDVRREASLILAELVEPEAFSLLLTHVTLNPADERALEELAVLSCIDFRGTDDPVASWWGWWDLVVHDDARAWVAAAAEVAGRSAPALTALGPEPTLEGQLFFLALLGDQRPHVVERARRALSLSLGRDLELATDVRTRADQIAALEAELRAR